MWSNSKSARRCADFSDRETCRYETGEINPFSLCWILGFSRAFSISRPRVDDISTGPYKTNSRCHLHIAFNLLASTFQLPLPFVFVVKYREPTLPNEESGCDSGGLSDEKYRIMSAASITDFEKERQEQIRRNQELISQLEVDQVSTASPVCP